MKTTQILKAAALPVLTVFTLISVPNTALADYLRSDGFGGEYRYELWSSDDGQKYYLKIWDKDEDPQKDSYVTRGSFKSSSDALNYFDCYYALKSLPQCPKNR
ncbi:hypothetical protein A0J48_013570 [Sphaerospermopsis aphanizomenoides BCCUSP55]|uniref:hypothetical protein n=1 Tax=Sphaerospermopsis aphanizomenoides TaxID=459663 RepID=UPI001903DF07|nr:hypothetical protein [Sphaerospermopsis aphanizomenoides]MBK1988554.1 hypothetical protein [Sphaerospermopsis aphanizomenoides BCCUSP55]